MLKRVLVATGGTGGHIFPALAVAQKILEMHPDCRVVFAGGEYGPEREIVTKAGITFKSFPARGVLGRGFKSLGSLFWMSKSLVLSLFFLRSFKPEVVIGFGGYAGFMPVLAARWLKIPTAIHEQNSLPGVTNRILGKKADRVLLSFPDENSFFPALKVVETGNPVRREIVQGVKGNSSILGRVRRLLVVGGSQGAKAINDAVLASIKELKAMDVEIWHQTGQVDFERVSQVYQKEYPQARVEPFIADMAEAYSFATLVLCRAGASTLAELCVTGRPSILIPFPYATHNHQMTNARHLEQQGAALVLAQSYLHEVNLARVVGDLLAMPDKLRRMSRAALEAGRPDAALKIVQELEKIRKKSSK
ncbi:undecaprenyldiphospho-muramoylpentapeptide beta-N-acetylglucosaminyltransferase [Desulfonatronovibrio hydrogenovorans]|uniref:undecaprenyldiphospho-muramoylpentapeptide beta-N-acetylglucosaminyltransferase n=1 Tax=Desulfonatronovibrio hydrogenovorans TaxID=53245 RepID=UPI0005583E61|nr:undecaprenyldiphospho-muramoylpentapeptide beta-N-acetylglucosaminyltransferase [Desulfonatronovibrio hydrogenovorans]